MLSKFLLVSVLFFSFFVNNCNEKPGEGEVAKKGYTTAQPIIEALEKYLEENQDYPESLNKLQPKYIKELPKDGNGIRYKYSYLDDKKTYILSFTYDGSGLLGINECSYYSNTKAWSCHGKV
jgi:hypothetical protein